MPIASSDIPNLLLAGIDSAFFEAYNTTIPQDWQQIAMTIPSTKDTETYAWLGELAGMREWLGDRQIKALSEYAYSLKNRAWEDSIGVDTFTLEDDQYGQIAIRARSLGEQARMHRDQIVVETLVAGTTGDCYDGQDFFDASHSSADSGTQSNLGSSALSAASLDATRIAMAKFANDRGVRMGIIPDTIVIPVDLERVAKELILSPYNPESANQVVNTNQGTYRIIVSPWLTDTNNWFMLCTNRVVKPLIFQNRLEPIFSNQTQLSASSFMRHQYMYGVAARYAVGYGMWQMAYCHVV